MPLCQKTSVPEFLTSLGADICSLLPPSSMYNTLFNTFSDVEGGANSQSEIGLFLQEYVYLKRIKSNLKAYAGPLSTILKREMVIQEAIFQL